MQNRQRVQQLREEFGKGPGRLEGETRMRMVQALSDIRFDSRSWLARFPDAGAVERAAAGRCRRTATARLAGHRAGARLCARSRLPAEIGDRHAELPTGSP